MKSYYIDIHTHYRRTEIITPTQCGVHPWHAGIEKTAEDLSTYEMVGEIGLDYACTANREEQHRLFRAQLAEAERLQKPVVLHVVRSFEDVMSILGGYSLRGVVFHGFIGSVQQAMRCFNKGYYLSFGERSLRSPRTREVIATAPVEQIFCETDDSTTTTIEEIYHAVATIRCIGTEDLKKHIVSNYEKLMQR